MSEVPKSHTNSLDSTGERALGTGEAVARQEDGPTKLRSLKDWLLGAIAIRKVSGDIMSIANVLEQSSRPKRRRTSYGLIGASAKMLVNIPSVYPASQSEVEYEKKVRREMQTLEYKEREQRLLDDLFEKDAARRRMAAKKRKRRAS